MDIGPIESVYLTSTDRQWILIGLTYAWFHTGGWTRFVFGTIVRWNGAKEDLVNRLKYRDNISNRLRFITLVFLYMGGKSFVGIYYGCDRTCLGCVFTKSCAGHAKTWSLPQYALWRMSLSGAFGHYAGDGSLNL